jgi:SAM-dependent methyltransferase
MDTLPMTRRETYLRRYASAEWRAKIFADMVLDDLRELGPACTVVDIGCGGGFDDSRELQQRIAAHAGTYVGVEPDAAMAVGPHFSIVHRCPFESAPIPSASVDLAFCVMVTEHIEKPADFMARVADILRDGGVFWAFTIDLRHWSAWSSLLMEKSGAKDVYLDLLHGRRGVDRYCNYPVRYRLNTPGQVRRHAAAFRDADFLSLSRIGAEDGNLPRWLRPMNHFVDRVLRFVGAPGSNLAYRLTRAPRSARARHTN